MIDPWRAGGFGLYIHWPFCAAKCPYCDFNSHVSRAIDQSAWRSAYLSEIERAGRETGDRILGSVFFGGGTPSLMDPETVHAILDRVRATWPLANDVEITLEANPSSVEADKFRSFRQAGVDRVSLGIQALDDASLRRLGRLHDTSDALRALDIARDCFERVSFDLIYGRQDQGLEDWEAELTRALSFGPDHLSLYQLTIEDGTAFGDRFARGKLAGLPDEDLQADLYAVTEALTDRAGLPAYEISNHARKGYESRHNLTYWRSGDWIGIGPGAHGRLSLEGVRWATETDLRPGAWLAASSGGDAAETRRALTGGEALDEFVLMGMRTVEGLPLDRLRGYCGHDAIIGRLTELADRNIVSVVAGHAIVQRHAWPVLNAVLREIL